MSVFSRDHFIRWSLLFITMLIFGEVGLGGCTVPLPESKDTLPAGCDEDPTAEECLEYHDGNISCDSYPSEFGVADADIFCVDADVASEFGLTSYCIGNGIYTSIASALSASSSSATSGAVAIFLASGQEFDPVTISSSAYSDTTFVGCKTTSTILASTGSTRAVSVDGASGVSFQNLTIQGLGSAGSAYASDPNDAATVYAGSTATDFQLNDVTIEENYYQAVLLEEGAQASFDGVTISGVCTGCTAATGDFATSIGIWNEGTLAVSGSTISAYDVGVVNYGGFLTLTGDTFTTNISGAGVAGVYTAGRGTTTVSGAVIDSSTIGVWGDQAYLTIEGSSNISGSSATTPAVVACQGGSWDGDPVDYTANLSSSTLGVVLFEEVTANGSSNTVTSCTEDGAALTSGSQWESLCTAGTVDCDISTF